MKNTSTPKYSLYQTLEQLDKQNWGEPNYDSHLVTACHALHRKPLKDFAVEDIRIMIGQNISLDYLIPLAIERLKDNILAEGDLYKGDLLNSVLTSDRHYWQYNKRYWQVVCKLFEQHKVQLNRCETTESIRNKLFSNFDHFKEMYGFV